MFASLCFLVGALALPSGCTRPSATEAGEVRVFAAVSTSDALEELGRRHEQATGQKVTFAFGASNELARQLSRGAQADLFLAADSQSMSVASDSGRIDTATLRPLLTNSLVAIAPSSAAEGEPGPAASLEDVLKVKRLAVGDPEGVPAGRYAKSWLQRRGLWETVAPNIVPMIDARAVIASVRSGAAEAGIAYSTDAARTSDVRVVLRVPPGEGLAIVYPVALLSGASSNGRAFFERLFSAEGREVFTRHGFGAAGVSFP